MYRKICLSALIASLLLLSSLDLYTYDRDEDRRIHVEIRGEIEKPGVYDLDLGATYDDLFELAQIDEDADIRSFSLQQVLRNNEVIVVPPKKEISLISINSAGVDELCTLPGIGTATAEKIIAYRQENGSFMNLEELMNVKGIGIGKFEKIREYITL